MFNNKLLSRRQIYSTKYKRNVKSKDEFIKKFNCYLLNKYPRVELRKPGTNVYDFENNKKISFDLFLIGKYKRRKNNKNECIIANIVLEFVNKPNFNKITKIIINKDIFSKILSIPTTFLILINHDNVYLLKTKHIDKYKIIQDEAIILASRQTNKDKWPPYVKCGWKNVFLEIEKIIKKSNFL